ncbi:hypothetical protein [Sphingomonas prati]|uniref:Uncharacterized protein n=1 Tax=Sphingomonas prati TaxID=1843237 RepID=A0A7W9F177_9SPHN|nr:hypothetical protein [Sphingomonas prati]MBB5729003.1 hypothetical protein [Sphingomonas prati]GGE85804.1 hypothetical protein GCM10011404_18290 [Sphingomonas prati]
MERDDERADDAWFVYSRRAGRISAAPANAKGWVAFLLCLGVTIATGLAIVDYGLSVHPVVGFVLLVASILASIGLTMALAVAKGRRVD